MKLSKEQVDKVLENNSSETKCAGLFGPCQNPPDPSCRLDDPEGKGPPVHRCKTCADEGDKIFVEVERRGLTEKFSFAIDEARLTNSRGRGES